MCANWNLNNLKTVILISMTKNGPSAAVEEDELWKDGKKSWKIF